MLSLRPILLSLQGEWWLTRPLGFKPGQDRHWHQWTNLKCGLPESSWTSQLRRCLTGEHATTYVEMQERPGYRERDEIRDRYPGLWDIKDYPMAPYSTTLAPDLGLAWCYPWNPQFRQLLPANTPLPAKVVWVDLSISIYAPHYPFLPLYWGKIHIATRSTITKQDDLGAFVLYGATTFYLISNHFPQLQRKPQSHQTVLPVPLTLRLCQPPTLTPSLWICPFCIVSYNVWPFVCGFPPHGSFLLW